MAQQTSHAAHPPSTCHRLGAGAERQPRHSQAHSPAAANTDTQGTACLNAQGPQADARSLTSQMENGRCPHTDSTAQPSAAASQGQAMRGGGGVLADEKP
jgi:hypothetical protein